MSTHNRKSDPYVEYIHSFQSDIHQYLKDQGMLILDRDNFDDFSHFCHQHMNVDEVDKDILKEIEIVEDDNNNDDNDSS